MELSIKNCYENRELSWLKFNERVLDEAADSNVPLGERLSFLSIFQSNLDEFFMVRVGSLTDKMKATPDARDNKTGMTCREQLRHIMMDTRKISGRKDIIYGMVMNEMTKYDVEIINFSSLSEADAAYLEEYFTREIRPLLAPQIIGKRQPFPFLKGKEIYAVVALATKHNNTKLGIVPCHSNIFPKLIAVPGQPGRYMLAEELILHFMPKTFENYKIIGKSLVRIIRNADIDMDELDYEDASDYRKEMEKIIKSRKKLAPVKLEYSRYLGESVIKMLCKYLDLETERAFHSESPLDLSVMGTIRDFLKSNPNADGLFYRKLVPQDACGIDKDRSMMEQVFEKDRILAYPYESIDPFIKLLFEAADDPKVVSIRITLYRVAENSRIVEALARAADNGKDVMVLVELRARFDEEHNIECSRMLEAAGCRIIYGFDHFKVHSKLCQITRQGENGIEYITQVGTGNYNEKTATLYTDFCLMTASKDIAVDAAGVFNSLSLGVLPDGVRTLMVAPKCLQNRVVELIEEQIEKAEDGEESYIGLKMNSLSDKLIINKLIEASQAGVKIDMVIRGICCLKPGVPGYTENITIVSIVGRFLEHARVYIFGKGEEQKVYISSADFMTRNTVNRVEVAAPVNDPQNKARVLGMFQKMMEDNVKARIERADGVYLKKKDQMDPLNSQEYFFRLAYKNQGED